MLFQILHPTIRLTDKVIIRMQFYTTEEKMRADIMSSFYHCSSSDSKPRHDYCPKTSDSWCFYKSPSFRTNTCKPQDNEIVFQPRVRTTTVCAGSIHTPATDIMMKRCLQGFLKTQMNHFITVYGCTLQSISELQKKAGICCGSRNQQVQCWPPRQQHLHRNRTPSDCHHCYIS